ncbi:MAG TPA: Nif3-like dinuclear metal center hexameric protein, partial [Gaiellaceae bacterium]|jgi:dinuclear metal center YbgI/SA1388 family protein
VADRDEILAFASELLDLDAYPDYGPMGLQVAGAREVGRIACGVSASLELFERAEAAEAQMLLVHHGLLWDRDSRVIDDAMRRRLKTLFDAEITLAAYHLALDAHPEVGNNALLARELGVEPSQQFAGIGFGGPLTEPVSVEEFAARVREKLGSEPVVFAHGPERVERAAVVTGGAGRHLADAAREGYDLFLTGEPEEPSLHTARELGIHFVAAGHYATERIGIQALAQRLAKQFDLDWKFIDLPNPV